MATRHEVTKEECATFNDLCNRYANIEFRREQMRDLLKNSAFPKADAFLKCICEGVNPPIIHDSKKQRYLFAKPPVHIMRLQTVWKEYSAYIRRQNKIYRNKKQAIEKKLQTSPVYKQITNDDVEAAARLLKSKGWKLRRPVLSYEEY